jgi:ZIP family zinc transporter
LIAALMAAIGIVAVSLHPNWAQRHRSFFAALASGVLLSTALFILPRAYGVSSYAPLAVLLGYFSLFVIGRFARRPEGRAFTAFFAIAAHSTIDGFEYGLLFSVDQMAGILGAVGLILHEFSEGVLLFLILRQTGMGRVLSIVLALFGAAVTTPVGTLATLSVLPNLTPESLSLALAFAAGALLFVGASQLPEEFGKLRFKTAVSAYAVGALLAVVMMWSHTVGHSHDDHDDHGADLFHHPH